MLWPTSWFTRKKLLCLYLLLICRAMQLMVVPQVPMTFLVTSATRSPESSKSMLNSAGYLRLTCFILLTNTLQTYSFQRFHKMYILIRLIKTLQPPPRSSSNKLFTPKLVLVSSASSFQILAAQRACIFWKSEWPIPSPIKPGINEMFSLFSSLLHT